MSHPYLRHRRCLPALLAVVLALVVVAPAGAFDAANVSAKHRDQLTDVNAASFIIVRLTDESGLMVGEKGLSADPDAAASGNPSVLAGTLAWKGQALEMRRLFDAPVEQLAAQRRELLARGEQNVPNLNAYGVLRTPGGVPLQGAELQELLTKLNEDPSVAIAYPRPHYEVSSPVAPRSAPSAAVTSSTPSFEHLQTYRGYPYQLGFGARAVKNWPGSQGDNVKIIDIEGGWHWDHEDLPTPFVDIGTHGADGYKKHGSSVMGVIAGQDNGFGVTGFVPNAQVGGVVCEVAWDDPSNWTDASTAIMTALGNLAMGDIILIELQAAVDPVAHTPWLPLEYWPANFEAMRSATMVGVIVVEAAGNANENLDDYLVDFVRDDPILDCGALMVGGIDVGTGLRHGGLNYGARVDVHAWGEQVATAGGGDLYGIAEGLPNTQYYRDNFGGTSSASAIMAGVVGSVQSLWVEELGTPLDGRAMRNILRLTGHSTPGVSELIGPRPDIPEVFRYFFDTGAPFAVDDLFALNVLSNSISLGWHAPADDYRDLIVADYDIRYSESPLNDANFDAATPVPGVMQPWPPGSIQMAEVFDLQPGTTYYFGLRSHDPAGRPSPLSNVVTVTTAPPAPRLSLDFTEQPLGMAVLGHSASGQFTVENIGSADLLITGCTPMSGPDVAFSCDSYPTAPIPPGGTGVFHVSGTPATLAEHIGALQITSNDPSQATVYKMLSVVGVDLEFQDTVVQAAPGATASGLVTVTNPSAVSVSYGGMMPRLGYDISHGQGLTDYLYIDQQIQGHFSSSTLAGGLTAEALAGVDVLFAYGAQTAWTAAERLAVSDWVAAGGGLYLEARLAMDQDVHLNPLLADMGFGSPLAFAYDPSHAGVTTHLAADPLLDGMTEVTLVNAIYKLTTVPTGADWLFRTPDGLVDKAFKGTYGSGRVVVVADQLFGSSASATAHAAFALNGFQWLSNWPTWLSIPDTDGTIPAGSSVDMAIDVDAVGLVLGSYTHTVSAIVMGTAIEFDITLEVIDATITNVVKGYHDVDESTVGWQTNLELPCRFRYRDYGTSTWSAPINLPAGTQHEITFPTTRNSKYDGLIEVTFNGAVLADSLIVMKTPKVYPIEMTSKSGDLPQVTALRGAAPNPFNPVTVVSFDLARGQRVQLDVYDVRGRLVRALIDEARGIGRHEVTWDGRDDRGHGVGSGVYFVRMAGETYRNVQKVTLLK